MSDISSYSYSQSPLVYYNTSSTNPGVYLEWDRYNTTDTVNYILYNSTSFEGPFTAYATIPYPTNEYVDPNGTPATWYKVEEVDLNNQRLSMSQPFGGDELLIKSSLRYELEHLLNIPIFDEEVVFHRDRSRASCAFPFWNYMPKPEIRITGFSNEGDRDSMIQLSEVTPIYKTINASYNPIEYSRDGNIVEYANGNNYPDGLMVKYDYMSNLYFVDNLGNSVQIHPYDTVFATYSVKMFTTQHMNSALYMALQTINSQPGASKYPSVATAPFYYDPAIVFGACYYLIRALLVSLTGRQRRLLLEDPDAKIIEDLRNTANMYKEEFEKLLEKLPIARYPGVRGIVVPEFNMPGGRSRFFRYIWNLGTAS